MFLWRSDTTVNIKYQLSELDTHTTHIHNHYDVNACKTILYECIMAINRRALETAKQGNEVNSLLDVLKSKKKDFWLTSNYLITQPSRKAYFISTTLE